MTLTAKNSLCSEYLYYCLDYQGLAKIADTTSIPQINNKHINPFRIPIHPTVEEQTGNALNDADALIQSLTRLIAKKRQIKQGAMQTLLNPYENNGKLKVENEERSQLTTTQPQLKKRWVVKKLEDILESIQSGGNYANHEKESEFPLIKMGNMRRGYISLAKVEYVKSEESVAERDLLIKGDVLFNTRNTLELVGKVAIWLNELPKAYFNSNILRLKFKKCFVSSNGYMNSTLNQQRQIQQLKAIATGTTSVAAIYTRNLIELEIPLAPKEEQTRIATILSDMDTEIASLETKLTKTRQIKQGVMQNLLTGRIRLI